MRKIGVKIATTYNPTDYKPFDTRQLVEKYDDLLDASTWTTDNELYAYNGMIVAVGGFANMTENDKAKTGIYYLFDAQNVDPDNDYPDVTNPNNWFKIADISDTTYVNEKLSATNDKVSAIEAAITYGTF